jgi:hypothetical protein
LEGEGGEAGEDEAEDEEGGVEADAGERGHGGIVGEGVGKWRGWAGNW